MEVPITLFKKINNFFYEITINSRIPNPKNKKSDIIKAKSGFNLCLNVKAHKYIPINPAPIFNNKIQSGSIIKKASK